MVVNLLVQPCGINYHMVWGETRVEPLLKLPSLLYYPVTNNFQGHHHRTFHSLTSMILDLHGLGRRISVNFWTYSRNPSMPYQGWRASSSGQHASIIGLPNNAPEACAHGRGRKNGTNTVGLTPPASMRSSMRSLQHIRELPNLLPHSGRASTLSIFRSSTSKSRVSRCQP